ncbi:MAG: DUF4255 domain-containing protein [Herpetosiphonaceae bacterium]|nr:DUF4255 domain-containing protein [Herpetosiphonaceae bacterium]
MSNALAIAAVTATLQKLLKQGFDADPDLQGTDVTMQPPDKARNGNATANQLNLFLYHMTLDGAWRNMDMPGRTKPSEIGQPPLPLNLYYLITAYGGNDDKPTPLSHLLLGQAMRILHDHPVLDRDDIKQSLDGNNLQAQVDLQDQVERVRITPQPLSLEEMSKLWTTFQTQYRISAAYQASVVLIESTRPTKTALPVLTRGRDDSGIVAQSNLIPPFPTLTDITLPPDQGKRPSLLPNDKLTASGFHMDGDDVNVRFTNSRLAKPIIVPMGANTSETELQFTLPDDAGAWVAGFYAVDVIITKNNATTKETEQRTTNPVYIALAPQITSAMPLSVTRDANGDATITLTCKPQVGEEQRVSLLVGDRQVLAEPHPGQTDTLRFVLRAAATGKYQLRLRIDEVDSLTINYTTTVPSFIPTEQVTIT